LKSRRCAPASHERPFVIGEAERGPVAARSVGRLAGHAAEPLGWAREQGAGRASERLSSCRQSWCSRVHGIMSRAALSGQDSTKESSLLPAGTFPTPATLRAKASHPWPQWPNELGWRAHAGPRFAVSHRFRGRGPRVTLRAIETAGVGFGLAHCPLPRLGVWPSFRPVGQVVEL
jgi:hypothetical protein